MIARFFLLFGLLCGVARAERWVIVKTGQKTAVGATVTAAISVDKDYSVSGGYVRMKWELVFTRANAGHAMNVAGYNGTGKGPGSNTDFFTGVDEGAARSESYIFIVQLGQKCTAWETHNTVPGNFTTTVPYDKFIEWTAADDDAEPTEQDKPKQVSFRLPKNAAGSGVTAVYQVTSASGTLVYGTKEVPPGTEAQTWTITLPLGVEPSDLRLWEWVKGVKLGENGRWYDVTPGGEDKTLVTDVDITSRHFVPEGTTPNAENTVSVPFVPPLPSSGPSSPGVGGAVWSAPPGGGGLSESVFQEGVDKIIDALTGTGSEVVPKTFPDAASAEDKTDLEVTAVSGVLGKLPGAPAIGMPGTHDGVFVFGFTPPGLATAQSVEIDFTRHAVGINIFRTLVRAALAVWFFFLSLRAIREAFAA